MKRIPLVIVWAISFAFVESAVVEYLRALYYPLAEGGFNFPVWTLEQLRLKGEDHYLRLIIEFGRELATLIMLGCVGVMAANNRREALAHFMIAFGVWDIFYYIWLKLFLDWPAEIMAWDLLFLVPVPWVSPVLAPILISIALIGSGFIVLYFEDSGFPLALYWRDWIVITTGGLIVIVSFCWDYRNIMEGGLPGPFNWPLFLLGLTLSSAAFACALYRRLN